MDRSETSGAFLPGRAGGLLNSGWPLYSRPTAVVERLEAPGRAVPLALINSQLSRGASDEHSAAYPDRLLRRWIANGQAPIEKGAA